MGGKMWLFVVGALGCVRAQAQSAYSSGPWIPTPNQEISISERIYTPDGSSALYFGEEIKRIMDPFWYVPEQLVEKPRKLKKAMQEKDEKKKGLRPKRSTPGLLIAPSTSLPLIPGHGVPAPGIVRNSPLLELGLRAPWLNVGRGFLNQAQIVNIPLHQRVAGINGEVQQQALSALERSQLQAIEATQEVGRIIAEQSAAANDAAQIVQEDFIQRGTDINSEAALQAQEAVRSQIQRQTNLAQEAVRIVSDQNAAALNTAQVAQQDLNQRAADINAEVILKTEEAIRDETQKHISLGQEVARVVNDQNAAAIDATQVAQRDLNQHAADINTEVALQTEEAVRGVVQKQADVGQEIVRISNDQTAAGIDAVQVTYRDLNQRAADINTEVALETQEAVRGEIRRQAELGQEVVRVLNDQNQVIHGDLLQRAADVNTEVALQAQEAIRRELQGQIDAGQELGRIIQEQPRAIIDQTRGPHYVSPLIPVAQASSFQIPVVQESFPILRHKRNAPLVVSWPSVRLDGEPSRIIRAQNEAAIDKTRIAQLAVNQYVIDSAEWGRRANWIGQLTNEAAHTEAQRQEVVAQEVDRSIIDQTNTLNDKAHVASLNHRQALIDSTEINRQANWVGQLIGEASQREGQRQLEHGQEIARQINEHGLLIHRNKRSILVDAAIEAERQRQEVVRVLDEQNKAIVDRVRVANENAFQVAIDHNNEAIHQASWRAQWWNDALNHKKKRSVVLVPGGEIGAKIQDHSRIVADQIQIASLNQRQAVIDHNIEAANQANWRIHRLKEDLRQSYGRKKRSTLVVGGELGRVLNDQQQIFTDAARQHLIDASVEANNRARWVGGLINQEAIREGQRQHEVGQEVNRALNVHDAAAIDQAHIINLGARQHVIDSNVEALNTVRWVGDLALQARLREGQRQGEVGQEVVRTIDDLNSATRDKTRIAGLGVRQEALDSTVEAINQARWVSDRLGHAVLYY